MLLGNKTQKHTELKVVNQATKNSYKIGYIRYIEDG